jgi:hypothetical protein
MTDDRTWIETEAYVGRDRRSKRGGVRFSERRSTTRAVQAPSVPALLRRLRAAGFVEPARALPLLDATVSEAARRGAPCLPSLRALRDLLANAGASLGPAAQAQADALLKDAEQAQ